MAWSIFTQGGGNVAAAQWADQFLVLGGYPVTPASQQFVYDWEKSEGGGGLYNPLNQGPWPGLSTTGQQYGGGASDYKSIAAGQQGAVDWVSKYSNYSQLNTVLKNPKSTYAQMEQALWSSPWAGSHYGVPLGNGQYGAPGSAWNTDPFPQGIQQQNAPPPGVTLPPASTGTGPTTAGNRGSFGAGTTAVLSPKYSFPPGSEYTHSQMTSDPGSQSGFASQLSTSLAQSTNPYIKKPGTGAGFLQDAIGVLTLGTAGTSPVQVVETVGNTDVQVASAISGDPVANIWRTVTAGLVRLGIGLAGLLLFAAGLYIIVSAASPSGAPPIPIPV